ncbi:MAG: FecR domain-containing protein [Candidatus Sphingomonas phytovorans]|nr:FecR domain-containing protein [Sphingomonas sp.]WEK01448.1 MAG: FecR domain-containing protein [Sphingomonas sp.]
MASSRDPLLDEAAELLLRLKATPDDRALATDVVAWKNRSEHHARAWAAAEKVWLLTGLLGAEQAVFRSRDVRRHTRGRPARAARRWGIVALAAAACLALVVAPSVQLRMQADYRTATGESRTVTLADGSRVQLDTGTAIALDGGANRRGVKLLAGRAYFQVAHDPARPFHVTAEDVTVTVTGTQFDVGMTDRVVDVMLAEGAVRTTYPHGDVRGESVMRPGDHFQFDRRARRASSSVVAIGSIAPWRRGKLLTEGATIADIVDQLRPYYAGLIVVTDGELANRRVTGAFDVRDPVEALRTVVAPHAGRVRSVSPWLIFVSAS